MRPVGEGTGVREGWDSACTGFHGDSRGSSRGLKNLQPPARGVSHVQASLTWWAPELRGACEVSGRYHGRGHSHNGLAATQPGQHAETKAEVRLVGADKSCRLAQQHVHHPSGECISAAFARCAFCQYNVRWVAVPVMQAPPLLCGCCVACQQLNVKHPT